MGLNGDDDLAFDDGGKCVSCSICLETVDDNGDRSWAKLQCGHRFHLDCIGSAFNAKGTMQCPNCRKIEKGQWLYANGCRSSPEFSMDDWTHDEDLYDISYSEMSFGIHWCPFGEMTGIPSSFEEGEFSSTAYHNPLGQHGLFAEHTSVPSAALPCPYITYLPVHPSSSNSNGSVSDASNLNSHWNGPSRPSELPGSYAFPPLDHHYHSWENHTPAFSSSNGRIASAEPPSIQPTTQRSNRANADIPRAGSFIHPFIVSHSSGARPGSSAASPPIPPYQGSNARTRDRVQALQAYYQQQRPIHSVSARGHIVSGARRSGPHRGMGQVASSSDQTNGFYFFPTASSGRNFQDQENIVPTRFHLWERDHLPNFLLSQVDRDSGREGFRAAPGGPEPGLRHGAFRP